MKIKSFIFCLLYLSVSCSSIEPETINATLPNAERLSGTSVKTPVSMLNQKAMTVVDDKLVVFDRVNDGMFKVFKLPESIHLYSWGRTGRGPDEFISIDPNFFRSYSNHLELMDIGVLKRFEIYENYFKALKSSNLPKLQNPLNSIQKLNDSIYVADNEMEADNEHILININKNEIVKEFGEYPKDNLHAKSNLERYQIYLKYVISNPKENKFAVFYESFPKVKYYNSKGELLKSVSIEEGPNFKYSVENKSQNVIYFSFPYATENYIYAVRVNKTEDQVAQNFEAYEPEIIVWTWNGDLVARYILDKPITRFAVSESHKKLYGTSSCFRHWDTQN
jgi:hypothetical protein